MASLPQIIDLGRDLDQAKNKYNIPRMLEILENLEKKEIKTATLRETQIGKIVNRVKKSQTNRQIIDKCESLIKKWKAIVSAEKAELKAKKLGKKTTTNNTHTSNSNGSNSSSNSNSSDNSSDKTKSKDDDNNDENSNDNNSDNNNNDNNNNNNNDEEKEIMEDRVSIRWETGDSKRDRVIKRLMTTLEPKPDYRHYLHYQELSVKIEKEMWKKLRQGDKEYNNKFRDLVGNIKQNKELKERILTGKQNVKELISMDSQQLASRALQQQRSDNKKYILEEARSDNKKAAQMTDEYKCGKCGSRKIKYSQAQTRSADEPMTTFFSCIGCGNRWKMG